MANSNLVSRLMQITPGHTSVVSNTAVTRWGDRFELDTCCGAGLLTADDAASALAAGHTLALCQTLTDDLVHASKS